MYDIRIITELSEAQALWRALSPSKVIFDEWDFRYAFYKLDPHPLHFLAAYADEEAVALMPLVDYDDYGFGFFAEEPCEENRVFVRPGHEAAIAEIYGSLKNIKAQFYDVSGEDGFTKGLDLEDYKYVLPLDGMSGFDDFLANRLNSKRRRSIEKELEAVEALRPEIVTGDKKDLDDLFRLNHGSFAGESYLGTEEERRPWRAVLDLPYDWRMISLRLEGKTVAVSLSVNYSGRWQYLITGVDFRSYPGLGKYLNKVNIEAAIKAGARYFDAGLGDCGWKTLWHFDPIPQYEFINF